METSTMTTEAASSANFTFTAEDGHELYVHAWLPQGEPKAVVQIVHGMAEHAARYEALALALNAKGIAVYGNDHRGHGRSLAPGQILGHMAHSRSFDRSVRDVEKLAEHLRAEHPGKKLVLLGHSMGSFYVQRLLYTCPDLIDVAVLSATSGKPPPIATAGRGVARLERMRAGKDRPSGLLQALSFGDFNKKFAPNRTDFDWLSHDEAEVDKYIADPFCGFAVSTQTWVDLLDATSTLTEPANVGIIPKDLPIYIFGGTRDAVGEMGKGVDKLVRAYRAAGLNFDVRMYEDGRHEMMHESNRAEVIADCVTWIDGALAT
jgi:alpha-beta hydrolase superfamily lysophospholipase